MAGTLFFAGCVERQLTINSRPQGAVVELNDEEVGLSPVTVSFNWYGDYNVRITKAGYETLKTHRAMKRPMRDKFPFDLFTHILSSKQIVDKYEWTFELEEKKEVARDTLIQNAESLKKQLK